MGNYTAQVYEDASGEWRWRVKERNGQIVAVSGEGYTKKSYAIRMVGELFPATTVSQPEIEGQGELF